MDYTIKKEFAEIRTIGNKGDFTQKNEVRIYCVQYPNIFNFQIRTDKPTDEFQKGVKRKMIATVSLTIEEMEKILEYMKSERDRK